MTPTRVVSFAFQVRGTVDCCSRTSAPGVARGWLPWGPRGGDRARTKWLRPTKDTGGGGGGRYERQRQRREELLAAASRRDRPGRRSPFKISPGKRGKSLNRLPPSGPPSLSPTVEFPSWTIRFRCMCGCTIDGKSSITILVVSSRALTREKIQL